MARPRKSKRPKGDPRPQTSPRSGRARGVKRLIYWTAVGAIWSIVAVVGLIVYEAVRLPPIDQLEVPRRPPNIAILADDGSLIANRGDSGGPAVRISELPRYVPQAFVAIEDRRFYHHWGIDPIGVLRAIATDLLGHRGLEGGSTLTQQLARNLFLTQERTLTRKIQEAILAFWLEHRYSKRKILELYLNRVYFGAGAYGVEAAAEKYFRCGARQLTLAQAAELAGLMKAPTRLEPDRNPDGAIKRAAEVVRAMAEQGYITAAMARLALAHPARAATPAAGASAMNYAADYVMDSLADTIGSIDQDIRVRTTLDRNLEIAGQRALDTVLNREGHRFRVSQGALVAIAPNGDVKALVGGRDYAESQFDRATSAHRQPGSTFKPFVYLAALEHGLTPDTIRQDAPITVRGWSPADAERQFLGPVTLTRALALSLNTVAVRLGLEVGPKVVAETAHKLGVVSNLQADPSIVLGTSEVTPLEITDAYAPFANNGYRVRPRVITEIRTTSGKLLYKRPSRDAARVLQPRYVAMMNSMLEQTLISGTARRARLPGWQAAGKTGTSQKNRDGWFIGYTSRLVAGVWLGNDDSSPTKGVSGANLPVAVWSAFMRAAHKDLRPTPLPGQDWSAPPLLPAVAASGPSEASATSRFVSPAAALDSLFAGPAAVRSPVPNRPPAPAPGNLLEPPEDIPAASASRPTSHGPKSLLDAIFGG